MKIWAITASVLLAVAVGAGVFFYLDLSGDLDTANADIDTLEGEKATTETELADTRRQLADTEAELDTKESQLSSVQTQLNNTETLLDEKSRQLETKINEVDQMENFYSNLMDQIYVRFGDTTRDAQSFITPSNQIVQNKVQEITGGYSDDVNERYRDYIRLYNWVVNNIEYSYDSYVPILPQTMSGELQWRCECWRTPEETLEDGIGDCEDMALLLASMMLNYNEERYFVWLISISSPDSSHMAVAYPIQGGNLAILDPAGKYYTGWQYGALSSDSISIAINNWSSYFSSKMPGAEVARVFSDEIDEHFSNTDEFITWAIGEIE